MGTERPSNTAEPWAPLTRTGRGVPLLAGAPRAAVAGPPLQELGGRRACSPGRGRGPACARATGLHLHPAWRAVGGRQEERDQICGLNRQIAQASARARQEAGGLQGGRSPETGPWGHCWVAGMEWGLPPSLLTRPVPLSISLTAQWPASVRDRCSADACCVDEGRGPQL